jgi:hypothetical protein
MSQRIFISLQRLMPAIVAHLEMSYPTEFNNSIYTLQDKSEKGLIGLNIVHSDNKESSLFWIDERFDVRPAFRSSKPSEQQWQFDSKLKKKISDLLKRTV